MSWRLGSGWTDFRAARTTTHIRSPPSIRMPTPSWCDRLALVASLCLATTSAAQTRPRFEVSFGKAAHADPITGRVYVAISRLRDSARSPIQTAGETGDPLFGVDVQDLAAGKAVTIDGGVFGHPVQSLRDIPAGEYWAQPFVNVYTRFARADGHTIWAHMDQWEGQNWKASPVNLFGKPVRVTIDQKSSTPIALVADQVNPPIAIPDD